MTLDYSTPPPLPTTSTHDHVYSTLLGVVGFMLVIAVGTLAWLRSLPRTSPESAAALLMPMFIESCFLAAVVIVLAIRLLAPRFRRYPTLGLNIILLLFFPIGTALAIYGFWKVDRRMHPAARVDAPAPA